MKPVPLRNDRTFGVEIEFYSPRSQDWFRDRLRGWSVGTDGSLSYVNGHEIRTPILKGYEGVKELYRGVVEVIGQSSPTVTYQCGLHVHHGVSDLSDQQILRIIESWVENRSSIHKMVSLERRNGAYCPDITSYELEVIRNNLTSNVPTARGWGLGRGKEINKSPRHRTMEIRLHEGTVNFDEIFSWLLFGQAFITNIAKRQNPLPKQELKDLLRATRTYKVAHEPLLAKANLG